MNFEALFGIDKRIILNPIENIKRQSRPNALNGSV